MRTPTKRFALPLLIILCAAVATPQFVKPEGSLASSLPWNATVESGHGYNIGWMSKDRGTLFTLFSSTLYSTTNDGASWTPVHTFPTSIRAVIDLNNGELLVTSERGATSLPTMWLSSGYPTQGVDANWLKVLEADSLNTSFYGWGLSTHEQYVVAIPYRGHEVFFSEDTGRTWKKIFKLPPSVDGHNAHMHGGAYDPYWDYIWIVNGDDANREPAFQKTECRKRGATTRNSSLLILPPESISTSWTSVVSYPPRSIAPGAGRERFRKPGNSCLSASVASQKFLE
jgi:hypothetical protein